MNKRNIEEGHIALKKYLQLLFVGSVRVELRRRNRQRGTKGMKLMKKQAKKPNANYTISYLIALSKQLNEIKDKYL